MTGMLAPLTVVADAPAAISWGSGGAVRSALLDAWLHNREIATIVGDDNSEVIGAAFTANGKHLITASSTGMQQEWDISGPTPPTKPIRESRGFGRVKELIFYGPRAVAKLQDGSVHVSDFSEPLLTVPPEDIGTPPLSVLSPDGRYLISSSSDGSARLHDLSGTQPSAMMVPMKAQDVWCMAISAHRQMLIGGQRGGRLWDLTKNPPLATELDQENHAGACLPFSPDGRFLLTQPGGYRSALIWDLSRMPPTSRSIASACFGFACLVRYAAFSYMFDPAS
jgi:WD40 repeat protein